MKGAVKAGVDEGITVEKALAAFLLRYRSTPHSTTGVTPSSLFVGRNLRTRLHLLLPNVKEHVQSKQATQKTYHDRHSRAWELVQGQAVWVRNFRDGPAWVSATIADRVGPLSYLVELPNGELWRRHIDHLQAGSEKQEALSNTSDPDQRVNVMMMTLYPLWTVMPIFHCRKMLVHLLLPPLRMINTIRLLTRTFPKQLKLILRLQRIIEQSHRTLVIHLETDIHRTDTAV